jgi:hypothetical protein
VQLLNKVGVAHPKPFQPRPIGIEHEASVGWNGFLRPQKAKKLFLSGFALEAGRKAGVRALAPALVEEEADLAEFPEKLGELRCAEVEPPLPALL